MLLVGTRSRQAQVVDELHAVRPPPELVCCVSLPVAVPSTWQPVSSRQCTWCQDGFCNGPEGACLAAISCWPSLAFRVAHSAAERSLQDFPALSSGVANSTDCKQQQDGVAFLDP